MTQHDPLHSLKDQLSRLKKDVGYDESPKPPPERESSDLGKAYELIATPIVAGGIGAGIDHMAGTSPAFFLILGILGIMAGFWSIYKASQNISPEPPSKRLQDDEKQAKTSANFIRNIDRNEN